MEVEKMVQLFNQENKNLKEIGEMAGMSKSTVQRRIKSAGYVLDKEKNIYIKCNNETSKDLNNVSRETINNIENVSNEIMVNGSYTITQSLSRALKLKAVMENKKVVDIVREAIEKVVEDKYLNM